MRSIVHVSQFADYGLYRLNEQLPTGSTGNELSPSGAILRGSGFLKHYNQAATKLAFHSNETSKDRLSMI